MGIRRTLSLITKQFLSDQIVNKALDRVLIHVKVILSYVLDLVVTNALKVL